jgi:hypothetical protein
VNNVGRSTYAIGAVQRCFFEALTTLKSAMVRIDDSVDCSTTAAVAATVSIDSTSSSAASDTLDSESSGSTTAEDTASSESVMDSSDAQQASTTSPQQRAPAIIRTGLLSHILGNVT